MEWLTLLCNIKCLVILWLWICKLRKPLKFSEPCCPCTSANFTDTKDLWRHRVATRSCNGRCSDRKSRSPPDRLERWKRPKRLVRFSRRFCLSVRRRRESGDEQRVSQHQPSARSSSQRKEDISGVRRGFAVADDRLPLDGRARRSFVSLFVRLNM